MLKYADEGFSEELFLERPALNRLREDAGPISQVIFYDPLAFLGIDH